MKQKISDDNLERMREYVALLARAQELREYAPSEDDVKALRAYVCNLRAIEGELSQADPTKDEVQALADHMSNVGEPTAQVDFP